MAPQAQIVKASTAVPLTMRVLLLYLEPLFAIGGVGLVLTKPSNYVSQLTRYAMTTVEPSSSFVYTQLAGGWLHFIFTEAVVLRLVDDLRIWRLLCVGMLLSDLLYAHSIAQALGGWAVWLDLTQWTVDDWIVTITTFPFVITRLMIVLGIEIRDSQSSSRAKRQ